MVSANKKASTTQPKLPIEKKSKPSLAIGQLEAAYELAMARVIKYTTQLIMLVTAVIEHATPTRKELVLARVKEMHNKLCELLSYDAYAEAINRLDDVVKAEQNSSLEGVRPKFIRKVVEALSGLGLDVDTASEFIARKQVGTPFEDDGDIHDQILLELGFTPALPAED